ncbi:hypothetical protein DICVIV_04911 [Dictyocaulus viviparus]|uniref:Uncharacterized protein n=1 Tax=Dictyocaulus viviparus TaxID=29172 RepID=A0A0D8Y2Z0_DICVI|nr:hypothetical protein DICVIV_04911 [Dictyocaulus viviparus]
MNPSSLNTTTLEAQEYFGLVLCGPGAARLLHDKMACWIQLVEQRLRMQDPSVHLMEKVAKQLNIPYDGLGGYSTKLFNIMWDTEEVSVSNDVNKKRSKK